MAELQQNPLQHIDGIAGRRQVELNGQRDQLVRDQYRLFGVDPPDDAVIRRPPVRVFDRQLSLANTAQPE